MSKESYQKLFTEENEIIFDFQLKAPTTTTKPNLYENNVKIDDVQYNSQPH